MNILYIEHYAGSSKMGMEFRPYYLSREWVKMGHTVTIIAGDYSHLRKVNPCISKDFEVSEEDGIKYIWLKTGEYQGNGLKRALTMERFVRKLLSNAARIAKKLKPDVVISSSTYPLDTFPAHRIAKIAKARYIHEVHDMWPSTLYEVGGMSKKHPFVIAMQIAENYAYRHCDKCVSLLPYAKDYMVEHGLAPEKFVNIQNGVIEEEWEEYESIPEEHKRFFGDHNDDFIVGYFGGHALSNALDRSLDIAKKMIHEKNLIFVYVGEGVEKGRLMKRADDENISNAFFLPAVSKRAVPDLLKYFSCTYISGKNTPLYRFGVSPNKMYDSMMAGVPVICAFDTPDTLIRIYDCGFQCDPSNDEEIIEAIRHLRDMPESERRSLGENGRKAIINNYTYKHLAQSFYDIM